MKEICVGFVGAGGVGAVTAGLMLTQSVASEGLYAMTTQSFGPQIRGGESSSKVRISQDPVLSPGDALDVCVIFHASEYPKFKSEMPFKEKAIILLDADDPLRDDLPFQVKEGQLLLRVPFLRIAREEIRQPQSANVVAQGVLASLFHLPTEGMKKIIMNRFGRKGEEVVNTNIKAFERGMEEGNTLKASIPEDFVLSYQSSSPKLVLTGNDAVVLGALWAGCNFFGGYPITPSSEIMHGLSRYLPLFGGKMIQTEDELSAINHCIGASYGGALAMTATSGPGLSLMQEAIGLAGMAEIPVVIVDVQRGGPSTGLPTRTEQADLLPAIFGSHGDAPKAVLAAADVMDCFDVTVMAFYIAEKYQMPVIVLTDQLLGQRWETVDPEGFGKGFHLKPQRILPSEEELVDYIRFKDTPTGISPMSIPGMKGGEYLASGIEHDEKGWPSARFPVHQRMSKKRLKKLETLKEELFFNRQYGSSDAKICLTGWGSTKGPIKEAVAHLQEEGVPVKAVIPQVLYPLNEEKFLEPLRKCEKVIVFESSIAGQFYQYLHLLSPSLPFQLDSYALAGGRGLETKEIVHYVKEVLG